MSKETKHENISLAAERDSWEAASKANAREAVTQNQFAREAEAERDALAKELEEARREARRLVIMIRCGNWKLTNEGLFHYVKHIDAKTGGRQACWHQWDKIKLCPL